MIYVGIDPGQKGGYAIIRKDDTGRTISAFPWTDVFFTFEMAALKGQDVIAVIEKVGARPGQGVTSMFNFGKSAGYIEGVLSALGIPYQLIPPQTWKREFSLIGKDKKASIETCQKLFPEVDLRRSERSKTDSDGKAEALLIALYAERHL